MKGLERGLVTLEASRVSIGLWVRNVSLSPLHHPDVCRKLALWPHLQDGGKEQGATGRAQGRSVASPWIWTTGYSILFTPASPSSQGSSNMSGPPGPHPCHCTRCFSSNAHPSVELEPQQGDHFF